MTRPLLFVTTLFVCASLDCAPATEQRSAVVVPNAVPEFGTTMCACLSFPSEPPRCTELAEAWSRTPMPDPTAPDAAAACFENLAEGIDRAVAGAAPVDRCAHETKDAVLFAALTKRLEDLAALAEKARSQTAGLSALCRDLTTDAARMVREGGSMIAEDCGCARWFDAPGLQAVVAHQTNANWRVVRVKTAIDGVVILDSPVSGDDEEMRLLVSSHMGVVPPGEHVLTDEVDVIGWPPGWLRNPVHRLTLRYPFTMSNDSKLTVEVYSAPDAKPPAPSLRVNLERAR
ncbi:MAG: hypothetical protein U0271_03165 [Polyangiaceae bacterium]